MIVPMENLMKRVQNRYQLVLIAARRANDVTTKIQAGGETRAASKIATAVLEEISQGKVTYEAGKPSKKEKS